MNQQLAIETINRLRDERDALRRKLEQAEGERGYLVAEYEQLRDGNRRLRDAALTVMDRIRRAGAQGWSMQQFLNDGSVRELVEALAQPAPAPAPQPEPASDGEDRLLDYPEAARIIALWLEDFCDERKPYANMIADAARRAGEEIERLRAIVAKLPTTADGVPIGLEMIAWSWSEDSGRVEEVVVRQIDGGSAGVQIMSTGSAVYWFQDFSRLYATREAALAASKGEVQK